MVEYCKNLDGHKKRGSFAEAGDMFGEDKLEGDKFEANKAEKDKFEEDKAEMQIQALFALGEEKKEVVYFDLFEDLFAFQWLEISSD